MSCRFNVIPWSAAAWRRFGLDRALSITKRRQAAALQGGARTQTPLSAAISDGLTVAAKGFSRVVVLSSPILNSSHPGSRSFPSGFAERIFLISLHFVLLVCISWHFDSPSIQDARCRSHLTQFH